MLGFFARNVTMDSMDCAVLIYFAFPYYLSLFYCIAPWPWQMIRWCHQFFPSHLSFLQRRLPPFQLLFLLSASTYPLCSLTPWRSKSCPLLLVMRCRPLRDYCRRPTGGMMRHIGYLMEVSGASQVPSSINLTRRCPIGSKTMQLNTRILQGCIPSESRSKVGISGSWKFQTNLGCTNQVETRLYL